MRRSRFLTILPLLFSLNCCEFFLPPIIIPNTQTEVTETNGNNPPVVVSRKDLLCEINVGSYKVGSKFDFSGAIQNRTLYDISLSSKDVGCLEYKIMKEDKEYFKINMAEHDFDITLLEQGKISAIHKDDVIKVSVSNVKAYLDGKQYTVFAPLVMDFYRTVQEPILNEVGSYWVDLFVRYEINNSYYTAKFTSQKFSVQEQ